MESSEGAETQARVCCHADLLVIHLDVAQSPEASHIRVSSDSGTNSQVGLICALCLCFNLQDISKEGDTCCASRRQG